MKAGRERDAFVNGALGAMTLVVSALLIWALSQQSTWYEREAADRSYHYARHAEKQIAANCRTGIATYPHQCVEEAKQAARENQRKEQDLAAQKVTAWWTAVMGGAAVFGVILSAFGVFLVWRTFRATQDSNVIARENGQAQVRAYFTIIEAHLSWARAHPQFHLVIKNSGQSPGRVIEINWQVAFGGPNNLRPNEPDEWEKFGGQFDVAAHDTQETPKIAMPLSPPDDSLLFLWAFAIYEDVFRELQYAFAIFVVPILKPKERPEMEMMRMGDYYGAVEAERASREAERASREAVERKERERQAE